MLRILVPLVALIYFVPAISPYYIAGSDDARILQNSKVLAEFERYKNAYEKRPNELSPELKTWVNITSFVDYKVEFDLTKDRLDNQISAFQAELRYDKVIVSIILSLVIYAIFLVLTKDMGVDRYRVSAKERKIQNDLGVFESDIKDCMTAVEQMRNSSIVLLFAGLSLALIGVAVFYNTIPQVHALTTEQITGPYLTMSIIRPVGILVFIESIAWFLLRQYRNSMEDYKQLYRIQLKRRNYKLSYELTSESSGKYEQLISSLLAEDFSGVYDASKTNEFVEAKKIREDANTLEKINPLLKSAK
ncbi:hypothetical protein [Vibrio fortis]|uniref:hypothetical protein n=1 Tax=Vibrio fortis TaxID=212667 RepID=UPI0038CD438A